MKIAVCEDEAVQAAYLQQLCLEWAGHIGQESSVDCFASAEAFLFHYHKNFYDVILLDIQMQGENGMQLARRLRQGGDGAAILFITAVPDFMAQGYDVDAIHYLLKPVSADQINRCLNKAYAYKKARSKQAKILLRTQADTVYLQEKEIYALEAYGHSTKVYTQQGDFLSPEPYGGLTAALPDTFFCCHRSYCIQLQHVLRYKKYEILLDNGMAVPVSRRLWDAFNHAFITCFKETE